MSDLVEFLRARLDEDEAWAREAGRFVFGDRPTLPEGARWRWECEEDDTPVTPDPGAGEFLFHGEHWRMGLRSEQLFPGASTGPMPQLALSSVEEVTPAVAGHIARWDPARVLAEVAAKRAVVDECGRLLPISIDPMTPAGIIALALAQPYADHPDFDPAWRT